MHRIDLGCGKKKQEGFIGVDRFALDGVEVVADLNSRLPFADDSVDLLFASHSLEHARDLMATMCEIYRICRHGAQICIVAPYSEQKLNLANPYHLSAFNEHTPRFWSHYAHAHVDPADIRHPHVSEWGLARSDNSAPAIDLRLARMELFYFPGYRDLPVEEQREMRNERLDVCDQVMYHLIVWKGERRLSDQDFEEQLVSFQPFEPAFVTRRKTDELAELLRMRTAERDQWQRTSAELDARIADNQAGWATLSLRADHARADLQRQLDEKSRACHAARAEAESLRGQLAQHRVDSLKLQGGAAELERALSAATRDVSRIAGLEAASERLERLLAASRDREEGLRERLVNLERHLDQARMEILERDRRLAAAAGDTRRIQELGQDVERAERLRHEARLREHDLAARVSGLLEKCELLGEQLAASRQVLATTRAESTMLAESATAMRDENQARRDEVAVLSALLAQSQAAAAAGQAEIAGAHATITGTNATVALLVSESQGLRARLDQFEEISARLKLLGADLEAANGMIAWYRSREAGLNAELARLTAERDAALLVGRRWNEARRVVEHLFVQTTGFRFPLSLRLAALFGQRDLLWEAVGPPFAAIKSYASGRFRTSSRERFMLGADLRSIAFREYRVDFGVSQLAGVTLAVRPLLPASQGVVGVEIVSADQRVLGQSILPVSVVNPDLPTHFALPVPLPDLQRGWLLRVFVRDADVPVAVYEFVRRAIIGNGERHAPFALLE